MTTLSRLSISGIRSYSSTEAETIEFEKPLTIIVGANGSGKTTIIEALKYICTGSQPPLSDGGKSFIHDCRIENTSVVKAQIKLSFNTIDRKSVLAIRSLQLTQKKDKREFKATEAVLKSTSSDQPGQVTSISQKCAEIDAMIPRLMGVSKSVLENVIFCHQEDSFWPLSDSKTLKLKFDDLFAATRYTKALDAIKKVKKEKTAALKELEIEVKVCEANRQQCNKLDERYLMLKKELGDKQNELSTVSDKRAVYKGKLDVYNVKRSTVDRLKQEMSNVQTQIDIESRECDKTYDRMLNEYEGPDAQLYAELKTKQTVQQNDASKLQQYEAQISQYHRDVQDKQQQYNNLNIQYGRLEAMKTEYNTNVAHADALIQRLKIEHSIDFSVDNSSDTYVSNFLDVINNRHVDAERAAQSYKQQYIIELNQSYDTRINQLQLTDAQMQLERKHKQEQNDSKSDRLKQLNIELQRIESQLHELHDYRQQREQIEAELTELQLTDNTSMLKQQVDNYQTQLKANHSALIGLSSKQKQFTNQSNTVLQYKQRSASMAKEVGQYNSILQPINMFVMKHVHGKAAPQLEFSSNIDQLINTFSNQAASASYNPMALSDVIKQNHDSTAAAITAKQSKVNELTLELNLIVDKLSKADNDVSSKEKEIKSIEQLLSRSDDSKLLTYTSAEFDTFLNEEKAKLAHCVSQKSLAKASTGFYKMFISKTKISHECTLCQRELDSEQYDQFMAVNEERIRVMEGADYMAAADKKVKQQQEVVDKYEALAKQYQLYVQYQKTDLPELSKSISKLNNDRSVVDQKLNSERAGLTHLLEQQKIIEINLQECDKLIFLYSEVCEHVDEMKQLKQQIDMFNQSSDNFDTIGNEIESVERSSQQLTHQIEECNGSINSMMNKRQSLIGQLNHLNEQSIKLTELNVNKKAYTQERSEMTAMISENKLAMHKYDVQLQQYKEDMVRLRQQYDSDRNKHQQRYGDLDRQVQSLSKHIDTLRSYVQTIQHYINNRHQFDELTHKLKSIDDDIQKLRQQSGEVQDEYAAYKNQSASVQSDIADIQANIEYRERQANITALNKRLSEKQTEYNALLSEQSNQVIDIGEIEAKYDALNSKYYTVQGGIEQVERSIDSVKNDLHSSQFRNIHVKYSNLCIDYKVLQLSLKDLDTYVKSLDNALMYFHSIKMREINDILADYWKTIYKGRDIDSIEIQSNSTFTDQKRSYHYRVVMVQGDVRLDMRGRCSAGQKVLASLLIRLALADTFCLQCGILALDEPTTNLDHKNIQSFAKALNEIIDKRKGQSNFQLIVITHDEAFVENLGKRSHCESYYRVYKDAVTQYSKIRRQAIQNDDENL